MASDGRARDPRRGIYSALNFAFAVAYALTFFGVIPSRHGSTQLLLSSVIAAVLAMGIAMLIRSPFGRRVAIVGCLVLLALELVILVSIVASAAFLAGVYGAFGRGGALLALVGAALTIQFIALLPAFQLKYLLSRAGRRAFGLESSRGEP